MMHSVRNSIKPSDERVVGHLPGGIDCTNCYETNTFPCTSCTEIDEIKENIMRWDTFKEATPPNVFIQKYGKVPDNYNEFCLLYIKNKMRVQIPVRLHTPPPTPTPTERLDGWNYVNEFDLR